MAASAIWPSAKAYVEKTGAPIVIKADGLAAGKGVTVAMTLDEALAALDACFDGAFGAAGAEVVVEEFMTGEEASFFCLCDGTTALPFGTAQDHKRVGDGDTGPNTGGMGAYSPAPVMTPEMIERTMREIIEPTMRGMAELGAPFAGILFAGLMITDKGPKLIEYNTRFGDPECQVLMMRLKDDLLVLLNAAVDGQLAHSSVRWRDEAALTVVMAARGYPGTPEKGSVIRGLDEAAGDGVEIFHAGTAINGGALVANGGRVLNVTATGTDGRRSAEHAPTPRSTASTGRKASAAATLAGRRWRAKRLARTRAIPGKVRSGFPSGIASKNAPAHQLASLQRLRRSSSVEAVLTGSAACGEGCLELRGRTLTRSASRRHTRQCRSARRRGTVFTTGMRKPARNVCQRAPSTATISSTVGGVATSA